MHRSRVLNNVFGWLVAVAGTLIYMLTLEPTVSFWDCGEFIATSYKLQIGHPPGAPLYQLLSHCFMLLAGDDVSRLAWWSNALSAVAGGLTAMFLFWTLVRLLKRLHNAEEHRWHIWFAAAIGSACYLFCDTAWFSAVESEVYSLSMLFSAAVVWCMVRWAQCDDRRYAPRWLLLAAFLLGLSVGVHQLTLLTVPMLLLVYILKRCAVNKVAREEQTLDPMRKRVAATIRMALVAVLFFLVGLTPYAILPIRAHVNPPINQGDPSTWQAFKAYVERDQYEHAPLLYGRCFNSPVVAYENGKAVYAKEMDMFFPRMWAHHEHAEQYYTDWIGRHGKMVNVNGKEYYKPTFGENLLFFGSYQLGYMYFRYLMWNFSGRYNDQQGFGNLQRGQFITGIPPLDRLYLGTSQRLPSSMSDAAHNRYFLLPLLLGIIGIVAHAKRDKKGFWSLMTLFLMTGILLSVYLNHPLYEPRERDYAYVLSFYAFAAWIGVGAYALLSHSYKRAKVRRVVSPLFVAVLLLTPVLMACQNWDDHDRSGRYIARDSALNLLNSCSERALLFTVGDNDTFPLWYLQEVEGVRTDVQVINLSLLGCDSYCISTKQQLLRQGSDLLPDDSWQQKGPYGRMRMIVDNNGSAREVFFSQYAYDSYNNRIPGRMQLCGMAYRLAAADADSVDAAVSFRLMTERLHWNPLTAIYIDETSRSFLRQYWRDAVLVAENLNAQGASAQAKVLLDTVCNAIPLQCLCDLQITYNVAQAYLHAGDVKTYETLVLQLRRDIREQMDYYESMSPAMRYYIPYITEPLHQLDSAMREPVGKVVFVTNDSNPKEEGYVF